MRFCLINGRQKGNSTDGDNTHEGGGGGLARGLGVRLFAFGGAYWPLATHMRGGAGGLGVRSLGPKKGLKIVTYYKIINYIIILYIYYIYKYIYIYIYIYYINYKILCPPPPPRCTSFWTGGGPGAEDRPSPSPGPECTLMQNPRGGGGEAREPGLAPPKPPFQTHVPWLRPAHTRARTTCRYALERRQPRPPRPPAPLACDPASAPAAERSRESNGPGEAAAAGALVGRRVRQPPATRTSAAAGAPGPAGATGAKWPPCITPFGFSTTASGQGAAPGSGGGGGSCGRAFGGGGADARALLVDAAVPAVDLRCSGPTALARRPVGGADWAVLSWFSRGRRPRRCHARGSLTWGMGHGAWGGGGGQQLGGGGGLPGRTVATACVCEREGRGGMPY